METNIRWYSSHDKSSSPTHDTMCSAAGQIFGHVLLVRYISFPQVYDQLSER